MTTPEQSPDVVEREWLIEQLAAWPRRVHPERTTNIEFLMKSAATALTRPTVTEDAVERAVTPASMLSLMDRTDLTDGMKVISARIRLRAALEATRG